MNRIPSVLEDFELITLPANQQVFSQGQPCQNYVVLMSGAVKVFARSIEGRELVLYRIHPGEICVLTTSCLMGNSQYPAEAITEEASTARVIPPAAFNQLIAESIEFRKFVFNNFSHRLTDLMIQLEQIAFDSIDQRIHQFLLNRIGDDNRLAKNNIVHATHQDIATEIGSAREVISRHLKTMEKKAVIKLHRGAIEVLSLKSIEK